MSTLEFNHLVTMNSTQLRGFAFNYTKNWDDAEDLIQDTLYKALRYKDYFQEGTNFKGWLFTIMRNIFINGYKRKKLQQNLLEESAHNVMINGSKIKEDTISSTLNHQEILKAVHTLSDDYRKPFQMFVDGFHYDEIAAEMGIPMGTVKSRIFHARQKLSKLLVDFQ
ncbi:MAG: Sigma-W factor [Bacteroidota bacterium]|jgi:RNA polymerase sigma-70 factor (ECF subfamily)